MDPVTIELKEFYDKADIILADLATRSGDRLIETAGMIHIDATSNGQKLSIKDDKRIVVHFPKEPKDRRKMDLFYADETATDSSVSNWTVDTVSLVKRTLRLGSFGWWYPSHDDSYHLDWLCRSPLPLHLALCSFPPSHTIPPRKDRGTC